MGYNIKMLKDSIRFLFVLKNNDGKANIVVPLYFIGESSFFMECGPPTSITPDVYEKLHKKRLV